MSGGEEFVVIRARSVAGTAIRKLLVESWSRYTRDILADPELLLVADGIELLIAGKGQSAVGYIVARRQWPRARVQRGVGPMLFWT